jgi:beta-N-acetylhexosaminidase
MTLEQKVGQVFMLGFDGTRVDAAARAVIRGLHLGGVTLFARNAESATQVARLSRDLQSTADPVPLFIAADQEGGLVVRVTRGATVFPGNMALGATRAAPLARRVARAAAAELLAMGINMNLAPVVDVNTSPLNPVIGVRAFGSDPELVATLGRETVVGLQAGHVSAVAKHFPGHGDTSIDSHRDLPVVAGSLDRLHAVELKPFLAAIRAGVDGIMTAHVCVPALEPRPGVPATLSKAVLTGVLRDQLGYTGLILTDALDMAAIRKTRGPSAAAVEAFQAGADLLLVAGILANDRTAAGDGPRALLAAVRSGRIGLSRLDASVLRIMEAKARRGILRGAATAPLPDAATLGGAAHRALALEVARAAITLQRDVSGLLPLAPRQRILVVDAAAPTASDVIDDESHASLWGAVREFGAAAIMGTAGVAADVVRNADVIVLATFDLARNAEQQAVARRIVASGRPVIGVALRGPYDAAAAPEIGTYLAAYGDRPVHLQAAAEALFGRFAPTGHAP